MMRLASLLIEFCSREFQSTNTLNYVENNLIFTQLMLHQNFALLLYVLQDMKLNCSIRKTYLIYIENENSSGMTQNPYLSLSDLTYVSVQSKMRQLAVQKQRLDIYSFSTTISSKKRKRASGSHHNENISNTFSSLIHA